ncbi:MAG: FAD-binding oxidoreductase, partial [Hyphomicrobiales bacterium]|nr:FAD-binding oxidoreductase [Hyphomicrobiales bacterium]
MTSKLAPERAALAGIVGERHVLYGAALEALEVGYHPDNLSADTLVLPGSTAEVAQIAALCNNEGIALVPQGGRTGLSGGAMSEPGQIIICLSRMSAIEKIDALGAIAIVEAGVSLQAVEEAARLQGLSVGIDVAARGTATIGGMISTNAGGMEAFRNGSMRHRIAGLEAVLASGEVIDEMTEVTKCNEGYDIKQLFCGAEGTLGIVTRAVLRLVPQTPAPTTLLIGCESADAALQLMRACQRADSLDLLHAEIMWHSAAHEIAGEIGLNSVLSFCDAAVYLVPAVR